ncbi:MAG TPA: sodium:proton antiporter NhaD [Candidatus Saccharimonadia bacterium]|nr:sodium:proton antiporter NhaD [Candidatus Saccharimonadia bacterium]
MPASETATAFAWTAEPVGLVAIVVFALAYLLVVLEERTRLPKSKPVMLAAAVIWALIAWRALAEPSGADVARAAFEHVFLEFAQLFFFLVVAMTYVSAMTERNVFEALRAELTSRGFSYRQLFWLTGAAAFFLSPVLDNLTTALVMAGVVLAVGAGNARFVAIACINLVVAANAGGAWSAFGDITTLMAWQAHKAQFFEFFKLFLPSLVNWLVPALAMSVAIGRERPAVERDDADVRHGGWVICVLFAATIAITVAVKQLLGFPPVFGMMAGLALLQLYAWRIAQAERRTDTGLLATDPGPSLGHGTPAQGYSIFRIIAQAEWDTLLFFYGVLLCVGGLATIGYMALASTALYAGWGHTWANVAMGALSAIVDNIPIMYAVIQMDPPMDLGQWLLITLTCGVGGSMLSVGSAAGVALMGVSRGLYTFSSHLRWTWAIALGYIASVAVHLAWNADAFANGIWR